MHGARAARLERLLCLALAAHALAGAAVVALLWHGLPGATTLADRVAWLAAHAWAWRAGWLPVYGAVLAHLALAVGLLATPRLPGWRAMPAFVLSLGALGLALAAQVRWGWGAPSAAAQAVALGDLAPFARGETEALRWAAGWALLPGALAGAAWSWALRPAYWSAWLGRLSPPLWVAWALAAAGTLVWAWSGFPFAVAASLAGAAFAGAFVWLVLVAEAVMTAAAPYAALPAGAAAPWFPPGRAGLLGLAASALANSRLLKRGAQALSALLGAPTLRGELRDVVCLSWIVPAAELRPFVPAALQLAPPPPIDPRAPGAAAAPGGATSDAAVLTLFAFRHHRLGPRALGPLRALLRPALQCVAAAHVRRAHGAAGAETRGLYLLSGAIDGTGRALAARLLWEGVPLHRAAEMTLSRAVDRVTVEVVPGGGSAPDLRAAFREVLGTPPPHADSAFGMRFEGRDEAIAYVLAPRRLFSVQPHLGRLTSTALEIQRDPDEQVGTLVVEQLESRYAGALVGEATPFCFVVPLARFAMGPETYAEVHA
ncbi:MAG TPA: hypothetical protein VG389_12015, partial [Myxococcota bacterium]|nr:hypothetical protein [Myxococcota bacterium]